MQRIVYLGGLGNDDDDLSAHLRSRREVEAPARCGRRPGHHAAGRDHRRPRGHLLGDDPPARRAPARHDHPAWVRTRTQPIAVADVVRYLVGVLDEPEAAGRAFDIGGPEVLAYVDMMRRVAAIEGRTMVVVPVPLLSPRLSSRWLSLVTDVDVQTGRSLIDSMSNEVVVRDDSIRSLVPFDSNPMSYDDAVLPPSANGQSTTAPLVGEPTAVATLSCHVAVMISMPQSAYGSGVVVITGRPPGHSAVGRPASMACAARQSIPAAMKPPTAAAAG